MTYEDELKNMSHKVLQKECTDFFQFITNRIDKPEVLSADEKVKAESLVLESITRMEYDKNSIKSLENCTRSVQNLIIKSYDEKSDIPLQIREWKPK
ncbi:MAG: hypothetical protein ACLQG5_10625 [Methanobacterium sp.]